MSNSRLVPSGVPQGSILNPLLSLLDIIDIAVATTNDKIDLYADDSSMHVSDHDLNVVHSKLQHNSTALLLF
jgi:hypothetical protein